MAISEISPTPPIAVSTFRTPGSVFEPSKRERSVPGIVNSIPNNEFPKIGGCFPDNPQQVSSVSSSTRVRQTRLFPGKRHVFVTSRPVINTRSSFENLYTSQFSYVRCHKGSKRSVQCYLFFRHNDKFDFILLHCRHKLCDFSCIFNSTRCVLTPSDLTLDITYCLRCPIKYLNGRQRMG